MKKEEQFGPNYEGCYGAKCSGNQIIDWITTLCSDNFDKDENGQKRWAGSIWGMSGLSKTAVVESFANRPVNYKGKQYDGYEVISIPVAQVEEMGDILGVPEDFIEMEKDGKKQFVLVEAVVLQSMRDKGWDFVDNAKPITRNCPPDWVPTSEKPGIILFDDGNRASIRILKGMMQLVQDYKTISWSIPKGWTIIFTGNPDQQDFIVATQDKAMITRQRHITMVPDIKEWAVWAESNGVDARGINFLMKYPEQIYAGERTNLRTLTEFFYCLKRHKDLIVQDAEGKKMNNTDVYRDGMACIDENVVTDFFIFATRDMNLVIEPEKILNDYDGKRDGEAIPELLDKLINKGSEPRVDILSVTVERLFAYMISDNYKVNELDATTLTLHKSNFQKLLLNPNVPQGLSYSLMRRVNAYEKIKNYLQGNKGLVKMITAALRLNTNIKL